MLVICASRQIIIARPRPRPADRLEWPSLTSVRELLPEEMPALDVDESSAWHIDVLGYDKPKLYLKYYAEEKTRESWRIDFPDDPIPAREDPPYDRDRHLPQDHCRCVTRR